jgi:hypothetical protein
MSYCFSLNTGTAAVSETHCLVYCLLLLFILKHQIIDGAHEISNLMTHTKSSETYMNLCYISHNKQFPNIFISAHIMHVTTTERDVLHEKK